MATSGDFQVAIDNLRADFNPDTCPWTGGSCP